METELVKIIYASCLLLISSASDMCRVKGTRDTVAADQPA